MSELDDGPDIVKDGSSAMSYFQGRRGSKSRTGIRLEIESMLWAVKRAFQRASHILKGRKRLYASSLAFKTVLALVPALAVLMAALADDNFSKQREEILDRFVNAIYPVETEVYGPWPPTSEIATLQRLNDAGKKQLRVAVSKFARQARTMGWAGFAAFTGILFLLLRDVEDSLNFLWGVQKARSFLAQVLIYGALLAGFPFLVLPYLAGNGRVGEWIPFLLRSGGILSFVLLWLVCAWVYKWVPNVKVRWRPALWGGFLAASLLETARWGVGWYALHAVASSRVYGILWMFPIILLWIYLCWTILLFGAETAYFTQTGRERTDRAQDGR